MNIQKKIYTAILLFLSTILYSQEGSLEMTGNICNYKNKGITNAFIKVFSEQEFKEKITTKKNGDYKIIFELGKEYLVLFQKDNFVTKKISINTAVPENKHDLNKKWSCQMDVKIYPKLKGIDFSLLEKVVRKIKYQKYGYDGYFSFDKKYDSKIAPELKKLEIEVKRVIESNEQITKYVENIDEGIKNKIIENEKKELKDAIKKKKEIEEYNKNRKKKADEYYEQQKNKGNEYFEEKQIAIDSIMDNLTTEFDYSKIDEANRQAARIIKIAKEKARMIIMEAENERKLILSRAKLLIDSTAVQNEFTKNRANIKKEGTESNKQFNNLNNIKYSENTKEDIEKTLEIIENSLEKQRGALNDQKVMLELMRLKAKTHRDSIEIMRMANIVKNTEIEIKSIEKKLKIFHKEMVKKEYKLKMRSIQINFLAGFIIILLLLIVVIIRKERKEQKMNITLNKQNKEITSSLRYAKKIQEVLLPDKQLMDSYFAENFVIFKPKDIVSGDFYWVEQNENRTYFSVIDCTGHGVPGAFISIIGNYILNKAVKELKLKAPDEILNSLSTSIAKTLHSDAKDITSLKDGMDLAIGVIDKKEEILYFSGAFNSMYILRKNGEKLIINDKEVVEAENNEKYSLYEIKADRIPIGGLNRNNHKFTRNKIKIKKGDAIYIFTDGFADQFGGAVGKKYRYRPFRRLFLSVQGKDMEMQKKIISTEHEDWVKGYEQMDDICIMGIQI